MAAVSQILYLSGGITKVIGANDTVTAAGTSWTFGGNVGISGNLDVGGDITSRGTVNLTVSDPFIDLGLGNSTTTSNAGGFTVQMAAATGVTAATIYRFVTTTQFELNNDGTQLQPNQIIAITGLPQAFATNEGLYAVDSVSGSAPQVVNIKATATPSAPFLQTIFQNDATTVLNAGAAFQTELSALAFANGLAFPDSGGTAYTAGTLVTKYTAAAVLADFTGNGSWSQVTPAAAVVTLQDAYNNGATIITSGPTDIEFTLTAGGFTVNGGGTVKLGDAASYSKISTLNVATSGQTLIDAANFKLDTLGYVNINAANPVVLPLTTSINIGTFAGSNYGGALVTIGNDPSGPYVANSSVELKGKNARIRAGYVTNQIDLQTKAGSGTINIGTLPYSTSINIGSDTSAPQTIQIGSTYGASRVDIDAGTQGVTIQTTSNGNIEIGTNGQTGAVYLGTGNTGAISIGNVTSTTLVNVDCQQIEIGNSSGDDHTINIGAGLSFSKFSKVTIGNYLSGSYSFTLVRGDQARIGVGFDNTFTPAANTISVETFSNSGTINIGSAALSHTINIGSDSSTAQTIQIGSSFGASDVNINAGSAGVSIDGSGASNFSVTGANLTLSTITSGDVLLTSAGEITATPANALQIADGKQLRFYEPSGSGSNYTSFKALAQSANIDYSLPTTAPTNGQYLQSDGSGVLSWSTVAAPTLQSVYNASGNPAEIITAASAPIQFTLTSGGFNVQSGAVNFGGTGLTDLTTFEVTTSSTLDLDAAGALSINSSAAAINIGNDAVAQNLNLGTGGARTIAVGSSAATAASVEAATIEIGTGNLAHTINVGTSASNAAAITFGSVYASGGSFSAYTLGATSQAFLELNGVTAGDGGALLSGNTSVLVQSGGAGTATLSGGTTFVQGPTISLANGSSGASAIYIGRQSSSSLPAGNTSVNIGAGTGKMVLFESVRGGVGIKGEYQVSITSGTIATIDYGVNPTSASTAPLRLKAASASTATDRFIGVVSQSVGSTFPVEAGLVTIPGTTCRVTFDAVTAATDVGKPVYLAGGANAGKCTLTAPTGSGDNIIRVGFLTNSTAATTANTIIFYPQFIAQNP
jgi:hypothetical protein